MDNKEPVTVPFVVYESAMEKADRQQNRLIIIIGVLIALLFFSNVFWLIAWNQYDYVDDYSVEVDTGEDGDVNYIGNNGDINNGTVNSTQAKEQETQ